MGIGSGGLKTTLSGHVVTDDVNDRIYVTDVNLVPLALFGQDAAGNIAIKVAKAGFNVLTATDDQLIFNSNQDMFKIKTSGTGSMTVPSSGTGGWGNHITIPHGLSYVPAVMGFVKVFRDDELTGDFWFPAIPAPGGSEQQSIAADATNIYLIAIVDDITAWYGHVFSFRYYILQETAT
jgi:hypothetical protein